MLCSEGVGARPFHPQLPVAIRQTSSKVARTAAALPERAERECRFLPARGAVPALMTVTTLGWLA